MIAKTIAILNRWTSDGRVIRSLESRSLPLPVLRNGQVIGSLVNIKLSATQGDEPQWFGFMDFDGDEPDWEHFDVAPDLAKVEMDFVRRRLPGWRFWRRGPGLEITSAQLAAISVVPIEQSPWGSR